MKSDGWSSALLTFCGLLQGVWAPSTYLIKKTESYKRPLYSVSQKSTTGQTVRSQNHDYAGNTGYVRPHGDLTSQFIREISEIKIPHKDLPERIPVFDKSDEESREDDDYSSRVEPSQDYNLYQNDEFNDPESETSPSFRDYGDGENSGFDDEILSKYKVTETIPGDNKYKPPKVKVVPVPPPCIRPAPPPPPPPKPTTEWFGHPGFGHSSQNFYHGSASTPRYRHRRKPRLMMYHPYVIRHFQAPEGTNSVIIRHRTLPPPPPPPPPPRPRQKEILKEVHIHHHHDQAAMVPLAVHIHKDVAQLGDNDEDVEDKRLDVDPRRPYYKHVAQPSGMSQIVAPGNFAEPPIYQNVYKIRRRLIK